MNWRPWEKKELKSETISSSGRCSALSRPNTAFDSSNPSVALFFIFELLPNSYLTHTGQRRDSDTKRRRNKNFSVLLFFFIFFVILFVQFKSKEERSLIACALCNLATGLVHFSTGYPFSIWVRLFRFGSPKKTQCTLLFNLCLKKKLNKKKKAP